ncbi:MULTISPECIES: hypothetical protein [Mycobacteroides]|uniref:hypothetical protein n=1 Tax=Mycobacteroides TaxID=670516 RepID=UPI000B128D34|nr:MULTISPECIES: hypothetical protein [Mycobacteroides]
MPAEDQELARAYSAGNYRQVIAQLYEVVARARTANHYRAGPTGPTSQIGRDDAR